MSDDAGEDDENLDEETQERVNRVRGKRDSRPSRRRGRSKQTPEPEQTPQAAQEEQGQQTKNAEQGTSEMDANSQTEAAQATQENKSPQPPQAEQETHATQTDQVTMSELEPVTQREHDTYYLDAEVREELERVYRRMSLDILEGTGVDLDEQRVGGRNRYYRPLALLLGARQIAEMSPSEVRSTIEEEDLIDDLPDRDDE
ncbi:hypothetical protein [Halorubrum yunnanense]|uniref:Uncharacterized protein n=1 Tax=Halorubrum yunnanense TaxID=1526162 RepID=A0ABD5YJK4_9EURY|nr:hypothetical protein [Halorubrum yunnanense]